MSQTRRLAAIVAADLAGHSRLMGADEEGTHERLNSKEGSCGAAAGVGLLCI
jgi:class 3 adenylate cyclase